MARTGRMLFGSTAPASHGRAIGALQRAELRTPAWPVALSGSLRERRPARALYQVDL